MKPANLIIILSDEHTRDIAGCYGHPMVQTPNIDRLAARGTRFTNAYTNCPICIPARASLATGRYVHQNGYWDNGIPYDGQVRSWHHELRDQGYRVDSIGKLHFRHSGEDHGFSEEIEPLHVVEGIGDILGCIREDPPGRHKRPGIEEAGPGDSTYIQYDISNADHACLWIAEHAGDDRPWVLFVGFVLPHPPYIAPPDLYDLYPPAEVPLPPQWKPEDWPNHPAMTDFRELFDYTEPFSEETVRRLTAAYFGACTHVDRQVGRVLDSVEDHRLLDTTRVIYTSDHGEDLGARGLFGKFTMYEESAAVPLIAAGPDVPAGVTMATPVSLVDLYPTTLEAVGASPPGDGADRPGESLWPIANGPERDRVVFSEYHALGSRHGFFMVRDQRYKLVHYVSGPRQLFDLSADPQELENLALSPAYAQTASRLDGELRRIVDPDEADHAAHADQDAVIRRHGGREQVIARGAFDNSPVPGEAPKFHL